MVKSGRCMVPGCQSKFNELLKRNMSYFQIPDGSRNPKKRHMAKLWLEFCGLKINDFTFGDKSKIICERHFLLEDLEEADKRAKSTRYIPKRVKFGAYPKIFDISNLPERVQNVPLTGGDYLNNDEISDKNEVEDIIMEHSVSKQRGSEVISTASKHQMIYEDDDSYEVLTERKEKTTIGKEREELPGGRAEVYEGQQVSVEYHVNVEHVQTVQEETSLSTENDRYVNDFVPEPLDKPLSTERKEAADLARWPPDLLILSSDINHMLTCGICKGYFYKATTITECLHTFCKGCLVNHFYRSLNCPTCNILVHPSDPFVCMKPDTILQDIVYKVFPDKMLEDESDEIEFYTSRGLNPPDSRPEESTSSPAPEQRKIEMISLRLDYAGTTQSLPPHPPLEKNFLRIPNNVTIGQIIKFLHLKMQLSAESQAALFINCFMLNEALTVSRLEEIFGEQMHEQYSDLIFLQYGVIPKANYFDKGLLVSTKHL